MAILGILLTILKIIGIILLVLLGIVLLVVAVILLVPIRYEGEGQKEETLSGHLKVTWLFHLLSASASLSPDGTKICIRIAGTKIYPKEQKAPKQKPTNEPKALPEEVKEIYEPKKPVLESHEECANEIRSVQLEPKTKSQSEQRAENKEAQSQASKKDPRSFLRQKFDTLKQKLLLLKKKLFGIKTNLQEMKKKLDYWKNLLLSDPMKEAFSKLMKKAKALLRHILPRSLSGRIRFGFDDPSLTGKILAYLSMIYPFTKDALIIEPEFETKELILEGNLSFRGKIRLGYLLYLVLSVVLDKNIRRQYKRLRQGGKEDGEGTK